MQNILNNKSRFQKVYVDQAKISDWLIYTKNRKTDVLIKRLISNERDKDLSRSSVRSGIMYGLAKVRKIVTADLPCFDQFYSIARTSRNFKILIPNLL